MGLPNVTVLGMAAEIGVSPKALYKHVSGLEELKKLIAEEIFLRWRLPPTKTGADDELESYMVSFSISMWKLVEEHPGIGPYMLREDLITPAMVAKMGAHQQEMARIYSISLAQSNRLFLTVAYFCVSVADTVMPMRRAKSTQTSKADVERAKMIEDRYSFGARALVAGVIAKLDEIEGN